MSRASFIRCFLLRGTGVLTATLLLLGNMGWRGGESTESDAVQPPTTVVSTTTTTEATTTTSTATTTSQTTTAVTTTIAATTTTVSTPVSTTTTRGLTTTVAPTTVTTTEVTTEPVTTPSVAWDYPVTAYEYTLLCKIVCSEYGSMQDVYERAKIVASVMNQSARLGKSIEACLYQTCVPWGFNIWGEYFCGGIHYSQMADAVDYYFANRYTVFADWQADSWYGSGYGTNIFHRQLW